MTSNFLNLHDAVLLLTFVECLFIIGLLRVIPTNRPQSRLLLSSFFFLSAAWVVSTLLSWNHELRNLWLNKTLFSPLLITVSLLLQGPCLYLYFCSLTEDLNFRSRIMLLHLIPACVASLAIILFHVDGVAWILKTPIPRDQEIAARFAWTLIRCSPVIYVIACFYKARKLEEALQHTQSFISRVEFKLADFVLLGFFIHWLWAFFQYLTGNFLSEEVNNWIGNFEDILIVLQINGLLILGLKNTGQLLKTSKTEVPKTIEQPLDPLKVAQVKAAIDEQKLYLENNINLDRFAELAGLRPREVTAVLREYYQLNFFEFINGLRLEEAKRLLTAPEHSEMSVLDIIYKSGFNSQSAFQRFFKRIENCTPTEYRRKALQSLEQNPTS